MTWPSITDFSDAIQNPERCFETPDLRSGTVALSRMGTPLVYSGNFASVYKVDVGRGPDKKSVAVRCFNRQVEDQAQRYDSLSRFLLSALPDSFVECQGRRNSGPLWRQKSVPPSVIGQHKWPR